MPKKNYHLQLKGYVGGADFDRKAVDCILAANPDKTVDVLIDSLGGSLATGLSISAAFRNHGDVTVHFVGLNASAATIASLGAKRISIDTGALYLIHQCSMEFFEWGSLNSDQFAQLINDCEKIKADLDKMDQTVAQLYASRCKRKPEELLELMKEGGWLTAQEALEWGFVDEITDFEDEEPAKLTKKIAADMAAGGIPLPKGYRSPLATDTPEMKEAGFFKRLVRELTSFFRTENITITKPSASMKKVFKFICEILGLDEIELTDGKAQLEEGQLDSIEKRLADNNEEISKLKADIEGKDARIAELEEKLDEKPAAGTSTVVTASKAHSVEPSPIENFASKVKRARALYDSI